MYAHLISVCGYFKKSVLNSGNSQIHQVILCCLPRLNTELCADRTRANPFFRSRHAAPPARAFLNTSTPLSSAGKYPFAAARHSSQHLLKEGLGGTANLYNSKEATSQRNVVSSDILSEGKSTLFNCLTSLSNPVGNYPFYTVEPNVGQVFVPAPRLYFIILVA